MGLEPTTPCLQSRCSSQLSYVPWAAQGYAIALASSSPANLDEQGRRRDGLLAFRAVKELANGIGMPCVPGRLVEHVQKHPAEIGPLLCPARHVE